MRLGEFMMINGLRRDKPRTRPMRDAGDCAKPNPSRAFAVQEATSIIHTQVTIALDERILIIYTSFRGIPTTAPQQRTSGQAKNNRSSADAPKTTPADGYPTLPSTTSPIMGETRCPWAAQCHVALLRRVTSRIIAAISHVTHD